VGCIRIAGELLKLGVRVSATKIRMLLRATDLGPAPRRSGRAWSEFLRAQARGIVALDLFTGRPPGFGRRTGSSRSGNGCVPSRSTVR